MRSELSSPSSSHAPGRASLRGSERPAAGPTARTHYASELVALGAFRLGAADPAWDRPCRTAPQEALGFPRRAFLVTPGTRSAVPTVLHPGLVSFARPEVEYRRAVIDPAGEETDWLWLRDDVRDELVDGRQSVSAPPRHRTWIRPVPPRTLLRQRALHALARRGDGADDPVVLESRALELVASLGLRGSRTSGAASPHRRARIQRVVELIAADPRRRRSTDELARVAALSPSHFCVAFRRETGRTVGDYFLALRLCTGLDRLREEGRSLSHLAFDLGFSSHAHFTARFRRHFGCTPSRARSLLVSGSARQRSSIARRRPTENGPAGPGRISAT